MSDTHHRDSRYHSLEVWRGLICILVVLEHTAVALWYGSGDVRALELAIRRWLLVPLSWNLGRAIVLCH